MKKQPFNMTLFILLGLSLLGLGGCSHSHKPLSSIYYGYYDHNPDTHQFIILAFDVRHPNKVALRKNLDEIKVNVVFPVTYSKKSIIIHTVDAPVMLRISDDGHQLTCPSCDGTTMPRTYSIGMDKGKAFKSRLGTIAFNTIEKDSKQ